MTFDIPSIRRMAGQRCPDGGAAGASPRRRFRAKTTYRRGSAPASVSVRTAIVIYCFFLAAVVCLSVATAQGQSTLRWQVPDPVLRTDLGPDNHDRQVSLGEDGLALRMSGKFFMIGRPGVSVEVTLPEPGRFELKQLNEKALVEVKNIRVEGKIGRAEIVSLAPPMSVDDAFEKTRGPVDQIQEPFRQLARDKARSLGPREMRDYLDGRGEKAPREDDKLREAYVQAKADEDSADKFKPKIRELIEPRPKWYRRDVDARLQQERANPRKIYHELAAVRLADEYLQKYGFQPEQRQTNYAEYADRVRGHLDAVYQAVSGKAAEKDKRAVDTGELARLRDALLVDLECRLYPEADPRDPNSQWFNGQRIVCQAAGIKSIKVSGKLDPAQHDRTDWWVLDKYSGGVTLDAPAAKGFRVESPLKTDDRAVLRVVATGDEPVEYAFELKLTGKDRGLNLSVYESPERVETKFPF